MKKIRVKKEDLLKVLKENMEKHSAEYIVAYSEFREAGIAALTERLAEFTADETDSFHISLSAPEDHTQEYADTITVIKMSCEDEIELDEHEAQKYLLNNWSWAGDLGHTRAIYASYLKKS